MPCVPHTMPFLPQYMPNMPQFMLRAMPLQSKLRAMPHVARSMPHLSQSMPPTTPTQGLSAMLKLPMLHSHVICKLVLANVSEGLLFLPMRLPQASSPTRAAPTPPKPWPESSRPS